MSQNRPFNNYKQIWSSVAPASKGFSQFAQNTTLLIYASVDTFIYIELLDKRNAFQKQSELNIKKRTLEQKEFTHREIEREFE